MAHRALESKDAYTIGWVSALPLELTAALAMLDEQHDKPTDFEQVKGDDNAYSWGRIGPHNIVLASLPVGVYGQASAASTATMMAMSFPIRFGLMVGIGGGIPQLENEIDIRLGDVVVSQPAGRHGGVAQYDLGKAELDGFNVQGLINKPPTALLKALGRLQAEHERGPPQMAEILDAMLAQNEYMAKARPGRPSYAYQGKEHDRLFQDDYPHARGRTCVTCEASREVQREERVDSSPFIHYGTIASGNAIVKNADDRAEVLRRLGSDCLCVETEAASLRDNFPCLVVRGICDYADSHKNDRWQRYAAATAAAYAKELLGYLNSNETEDTEKAATVLGKIRETLEKTHELSQEIYVDVKRQLAKDHADSVYRWLSPSEASSNYEAALKQRHPGTGQWLIASSQYITWREKPSSFLWLNGLPGSGKTVLSSSVIEDLMNDVAKGVVIYFFFTFADRQKQTAKQALSSLVTQLYLRGDADVQAVLDAAFASHDNGRTPSSFNALCVTFREMVHKTTGLSIVLDALDECPYEDKSRAVLLNWIKDVANYGNVRLLVTSRPEHDITTGIEKWARPDDNLSLSKNIDHVQPDISLFIEWEVRMGNRLQRWKEHQDVQQEICDALRMKADGMFRWVSCQLDALNDCHDYREVREALETLPRTLDDTYSRILANIPRSHIRNVERLLQFLTFTHKVITIQEAVDILAVDSTRQPRFDPKNRMPVPSEIAYYCPSLIKITTRKIVKGPTYFRLEEDYVGEQVIQLAHFSVQAYLLSSQVQATFTLGIRQPVAYATMAEICLVYLLELVKSTEHVFRIAFRYPLARHAATYWTNYAIEGGQRSTKIWELTKEFFASEISLETCNSLSWGKEIVQSRKDRPATDLVYAARHGLSDYVQEILPLCGADINEVSGDLALYLACQHGHLETAETLLHQGANININRSLYIRNSLVIASERGHLNIVECLLRHGVDAPTVGNGLIYPAIRGHNDQACYTSLLRCVRRKDRAQAFQFIGRNLNRGENLLRHGAVEGTKHDALVTAAVSGHDHVIQALLRHGVTTYAKNDAFIWASVCGHQNVVQLLLQHGVDIKARDETGRTALHQAAKNGHLAIVKILHQNGASADTQDKHCANPLQSAAKNGHADVVRYLVENGAWIESRDKLGRTALCFAAMATDSAAAEVLIEKGAHVNSQDNHQWTPLQIAIIGMHHPTVLVLLTQGGADPNRPDLYGNTALSAAVRTGDVDLVNMLFCESNVEIDVSPANRLGRTALWYAQRLEQPDIQASILSHMAESNDKILQHAEAFEDPTIQAFLLNYTLDEEISPPSTPEDTERLGVKWDVLCDSCLAVFDAKILFFCGKCNLKICRGCVQQGIYCLQVDHELKLLDDEGGDEGENGSDCSY